VWAVIRKGECVNGEGTTENEKILVDEVDVTIDNSIG
jgi:hypothetical protein